MSIFGAEVIGTAILILLGDGVVAAVLLSQSKAQNSGWVVIALGWGMAVAIASLSTFDAGSRIAGDVQNTARFASESEVSAQCGR